MSPSPPEPFDPTVLRAAADLRRLGHDTRATGEAGRKLWVPVRHGVVAPAAAWDRLTPEHRHAAFVHATALRMADREPVFSHTSAAAVWGLPRVSAWPRFVEVTSPGRRVRSSGLIRRHALPLVDTTVVAGLTVTPVARTLVDLARTEDLHDAVAACDHALHHRLCTWGELLGELALLEPGVPGRARAQLAVDLADSRSMSVGESLSRVQMFRLNLPRPRLQVRVEDADGLVGYCDFGWEGVMGEFDGRRKYGLAEGTDVREAERVLWREKQREDRIRARGSRMARWVWADAVRPQQMARILADQGIRPQVRNSWFPDDVTSRHPRNPGAA